MEWMPEWLHKFFEADWKPAKEILELSAFIVFVIGFSLAGLTVLTRSFRFLRRMYAGEARGQFFPVLWTLIKVWRAEKG